jgi:hypothetical protein
VFIRFSQKRVRAFMDMNSLIVAVAQYLLFLILAAAAVIWLFLPRPDKVGLAMQAVVSWAIAVVLVKLAGAVHADPRPLVRRPVDQAFVRPPRRHRVPVRPHRLGCDGRPSGDDLPQGARGGPAGGEHHGGAARMAAHVHHGQGIVAGLLIAVPAVGIAAARWRWVRPRLPQRLDELASA